MLPAAFLTLLFTRNGVGVFGFTTVGAVDSVVGLGTVGEGGASVVSVGDGSLEGSVGFVGIVSTFLTFQTCVP